MFKSIHTYASKEPMLKVNAFIVESDSALVIVDTTLTMSDSKSLKEFADSLKKPLAGILLTHGHPDHVAGTYNISPNGDIPIVAIDTVRQLMESTEVQKHEQWSGMFGDEWIPKWIYPNYIAQDQEVVELGGMKFQVSDIGSGGDCDANSFWYLEEAGAAFLGDFIYHKNHTYMADGSILRWLSNIEKYRSDLSNFDRFFIGHGSECNMTALDEQRDYFLNYCSEILKTTKGAAEFNEESKAEFERRILLKYPNFGCQFMVGLAAERVASEVRSIL